jgi:hypothetical protein
MMMCIDIVPIISTKKTVFHSNEDQTIPPFFGGVGKEIKAFLVNRSRQINSIPHEPQQDEDR